MRILKSTEFNSKRFQNCTIVRNQSTTIKMMLDTEHKRNRSKHVKIDIECTG